MDTMQNRDSLTKEEATAFIGKNASFYLRKWNAHSQSTLKGWNWASMFFSIEWMVYRKMYLEAVLYFFIISVISVLLGLFLSIAGIDLNGGLLPDVFRLLMGIFGNALYRKKALRVLRSTHDLSDKQRLLTLRNKGGVSVTSVFVCIAIEIALGFLIATL